MFDLCGSNMKISSDACENDTVHINDTKNRTAELGTSNLKIILFICPWLPTGTSPIGTAVEHDTVPSLNRKVVRWKLRVNHGGEGVFVIGITSQSGQWAHTLNSGFYGGNSKGHNYGYNGYSGNKVTHGNFKKYGAKYRAKDIIGVVLDLQAGTLSFSKNGISQGVAFNVERGPDIDYKLAVALQDKGDSISLV